MKRMKKLASAILAIVMVLVMALPAMAAPTEQPGPFTITIDTSASNSTAKKYAAYQIFSGDLAEGDSGEDILSNIQWGNGVNQEGLLDAVKVITVGETKPFAECTDAAAVAKTLGTYKEEDNAVAQKFAEVVAGFLNETNAIASNDTTGTNVTINVPNPGYYLVQNTDVSATETNQAYTRYILDVVANVTVDPKSEVPTVDKKVQDETKDAEAGSTDGWGETADHDINESFQFKLTAKLEKDDNFAAYETYKLVFHDSMSKGITFEGIDSVTIKVTVPGEDDPQTITVTEAEAATGKAGYEVAGIKANDKGPKDWTLTIKDLFDYVTDISNGVEITVVYNAHLNEEAQVNAPDGTAQPTDNTNTVYLEYSNNPNANGEASTGTTPKDTVFVFTYEIPSTKYADDVDPDKVLEGAEFVISKAEGDKTLYATFDDEGKFVRWAEATEDEDGHIVYPEGSALTSDDKGIFTAYGLDIGTYTMTETVTPPGYNTCDPITIVVTADHSEETTDNGTTTAKMTVNGDTATNNDVVNHKGTTLPETGGIGTTIFYIVGAVLVIGAAVLLITRKRMKGQQQ